MVQRIAGDVKFRPLCVFGEVDLEGKIWPTGNQRAKVQVGHRLDMRILAKPQACADGCLHQADEIV